MNSNDVERLHEILEQNRTGAGTTTGRRTPDRENESLCPECNARITQTKRRGEVGHRDGCPRREKRYNGGTR